MSHENLRDLLKSGYESHAAQLHSGDEFAARYHGRIARAAGRRRLVRQTAVTGGALASVSALTVGGVALYQVADRGEPGAIAAPTLSASPSPSPLPSTSPLPSPSASPPPSPSADALGGIPEWAAPLPTMAPRGDVVDDATLRLVLDAQEPAPLGTAPTSVACGAPAGPHVDPLFDDATARILRPDTIYPTYMDTSYEPQPNDGLLALGLGFSDTADQFFVAVSTLDHAPSVVEGISADYRVIAQQGVLSAESSAVFASDDADFLYGAVVVKDGVIVGHADLWNTNDMSGDFITTALSTVNEVSARDDSAQLVYDYGVGPLEHMLWCDGKPSGTVDTYAVVGTRLPDATDFDYSMMWAGAVEFH